MVKKEQKEVDLENTDISYLKDMNIAYQNDEFLIAFNFNREGNTFEKAFVFPADKLQEIIVLLFQAGVAFQKDTNIDIGFGIGENEDEDTGEEA